MAGCNRYYSRQNQKDVLHYIRQSKHGTRALGYGSSPGFTQLPRTSKPLHADTSSCNTLPRACFLCITTVRFPDDIRAMPTPSVHRVPRSVISKGLLAARAICRWLTSAALTDLGSNLSQRKSSPVHYDFPPPSPSEHRHRGSSLFSKRGAGTELVVEMQDLLNVPHAFAVLGRCLPGAPPQISCQRCTRCLQRAGSKELPPGAGTCVKRHAGGGLGAEITPHEPAINPHHERELVTCPHLP